MNTEAASAGKKVSMQLFQWFAALLISFAVCNAICFVYERSPGRIKRENSATEAIWHPGAVLVHGTEGYGIHRVDENGYVNDAVPYLGRDVRILTVGASHSQGKEIPRGDRYTDILNEWIGNGERCAVYNVSKDAYFFPDIVNGFYAITQEFPDSEAIVIDIGSHDFSAGELKESLRQNGYDPGEKGSNIMETLSFREKLIVWIKETFPLLSLVKGQYEAAAGQVEDGTEQEKDISEIRAYLDEALALMKSEYDGSLIILYRPSVEITDEGLGIKAWDRKEDFVALCGKNGITFVDMTVPFLDAYADDYAVPYGFFNTSMGAGHLNRTGHRLVAEELMVVLEETLGDEEGGK